MQRKFYLAEVPDQMTVMGISAGRRISIRRQQMNATFDLYLDASTYFIAFHGTRAIGTIRVINDSTLGLPCENGVTLGALRPGNALVELGHFLIVPEFRWRGVGFALIREALTFSATHLGATHMLVDFFVNEPSY